MENEKYVKSIRNRHFSVEIRLIFIGINRSILNKIYGFIRTYKLFAV